MVGKIVVAQSFEVDCRVSGKESSFLAQLTSYFSLRKFGKLWVFDSAVFKLLEIDNPFQGKDDSEPGSGFLL
jgi:hypothetical protein